MLAWNNNGLKNDDDDDGDDSNTIICQCFLPPLRWSALVEPYSGYRLFTITFLKLLYLSYMTVAMKISLDLGGALS